MARVLCPQCQRPTTACICRFICNIENKTPVLVLQHPSEVQQTKGTVAMLARSLNSCQVLVGENFSDHSTLNELLSQYNGVLLYPSEQAEILSLASGNLINGPSELIKQKPTLLIILDGTWRKTYKMFKLSTNLQTLKQVCLPDYLANSGQYLIRKVAKKNALSSLEATCYALALLDNELVQNDHKIYCGCYHELLNKFAHFNQFQLSFRQ